MREHLARLLAIATLFGGVSCTSLAPAPIDTANADKATPAPKAATPTPSGRSDTSTSTPAADLKVSTVTVAPTSATLSVPPENPNLGSAGYATTLQLDARTVLADGSLLDNDLVWVSSNPELVTVDSKGLVSTVRTTGGVWPTTDPVVLTGTSRRDPSKTVTVSITVTDDGTAVVQLQ